MKLNNKGLTLVELVITILILGMAGTMLTSSFVAAMRIVNRATLYKNASSTAQSIIELQSETYANNKNQDPNVDIKMSASNDMSCTVKYKQYPYNASEAQKNNATISTFTMNGDVLNATDQKGTKLNYHEFLPGNYYTE